MNPQRTMKSVVISSLQGCFFYQGRKAMKNIGNIRWALGAALSLALMIVTGAESQAVILATITPTIVTEAAPIGGDFGIPDNLRNSSGLSGTVGVGDDALKTHDQTSGGVDMWVTAGNDPVNSVSLTFTLDANYNLTGTYIWPYNQDSGAQGRSVHTFTIDVSTDGTTFTPLGSTFTLTNPTLTQDPLNGNSVPAQFLAFSASGVQKIRFDVVSNWDGATSGHDLVGLSEVRFQAAVPEPASLGILAAGGVMLLRRRRR
jgi:hypothetical protein